MFCLAKKILIHIWIPLASFLAGWFFFITFKGAFDYDEVLLAHHAWLVGQGLIPFKDFHAVHPTLAIYFYGPVTALLPQAFSSLIVLRFFNLMFTGALILAIMKIVNEISIEGRSYTASGTALVLFLLHPTVFETMTQFRRDIPSIALLLWGYLFYLRELKCEGSLKFQILTGIFFAVGCGFDIKLALLPVTAIMILCTRSLQTRTKDRRAGFVTAAIFIAGIGLTMFIFLRGVDFRSFFGMTIAYHQAISVLGAPDGFLETLGRNTNAMPLLWFAGIIGFIYATRRTFGTTWRTMTPLYVTFVMELVINRLGYRQYLFSFYIPLTCFFALFLDRIFVGNHAHRWKMLIGVVLVFHYIVGIRLISKMWEPERQKDQITFNEKLLSMTRADSYIVAAPVNHPIFRKDSTYSVVMTLTRQHATMQQLTARIPSINNYFSQEGYLEQLETRPPDLILFDNIGQDDNLQFALRTYLRRHPSEFEKILTLNADGYLRKATSS